MLLPLAARPLPPIPHPLPLTPYQVVRWCLDRGVAIVPGVATPTEMERAIGLGLTHLKFFPAETLGGIAAGLNAAPPHPLSSAP